MSASSFNSLQTLSVLALLCLMAFLCFYLNNSGTKRANMVVKLFILIAAGLVSLLLYAKVFFLCVAV